MPHGLPPTTLLGIWDYSSSTKFLHVDIITILISMVTREMDVEPNKIFKGSVSHAINKVTNLESVGQIHTFNIMEWEKELLLAGTTIHWEDVIIVENMGTLD